jgi:hypothetical protein
MAVIGLGLARLSPSYFPHADWSRTLTFFVEVVLAPAALLGRAALGHPDPLLLIGVALFAVAALFARTLLNHRWVLALTVPGFLSWLACQLVVALVPA